MKVDSLPKYYRVLAMLDWFEYALGPAALEVCIRSYYDTGVKEIKESIRGLYNHYWEILKNTFAIEPYQIDFDAHTREDCTVFLEDIRNYMNVIGSDMDSFMDKIEDSSCKWDQFLREMSMTIINIKANSFISGVTNSDVEVSRTGNNSYMIQTRNNSFTIHVPLEEEVLEIDSRCTFDDLVGAIEKSIGLFVTGFICKEPLVERLHALISMLGSLRSVYYQCGRDVRFILNCPEDGEDKPKLTSNEIAALQHAFDNIKEFEHYQSLFIELVDLYNEDVNSDPMELLERYYAILDEIYFDVYSLGTLVPSLIVKYNTTEGGNKNESR